MLQKPYNLPTPWHKLLFQGCEGSVHGQPDYSLAASSSASECSSPPASLPASPPPPQLHDDLLPSHGLVSEQRSLIAPTCTSTNSSSVIPVSTSSSTSLQLPSGLLITPTPPLSGGMVVGNPGSSVVYAAGGGLVYASSAQVKEGTAGSCAVSTPLYLPIQLTQNIVSIPRTGVGVKQSQESSSNQSNFCRIMNSSNDLPAIVNNSNLIKKLANNDLSISTSVVNSSLHLPSDSSSRAVSMNNNLTGAFNASSSSGAVISSKGCRAQVPVVTISSESNLIHKTPSAVNNVCFNSSSASSLLGSFTSRSGMISNCPKLSDASTLSSEMTGVSAGAVNRSNSNIVSRSCTTGGFRPTLSPCAKLLFSDDEDLDEEESADHGPDNETDNVQQAFPTDLSMNVRRKK
ncbi:hypothetical protein FHG87_001301 [Trinorchestia longiramus]|nr:hypothetical protein FHG87_001301 [Trinorchestia longiramus]